MTLKCCTGQLSHCWDKILDSYNLKRRSLFGIMVSEGKVHDQVAPRQTWQRGMTEESREIAKSPSNCGCIPQLHPSDPSQTGLLLLIAYLARSIRIDESIDEYHASLTKSLPRISTNEHTRLLGDI